MQVKSPVVSDSIAVLKNILDPSEWVNRYWHFRDTNKAQRDYAIYTKGHMAHNCLSLDLNPIVLDFRA